MDRSQSPFLAAMSMSTTGRDSPVVFAPNIESEEWLLEWKFVRAKDLIDSPIIAIDAETTVEDACDALLANDASCIAIKPPPSDPPSAPFLGLFDFADVNAFLTLAATQHTLHPDELRNNAPLERIVNAAKAGRVPVHLVSNISEKNPLEIISDSSTIVDLLQAFAHGTHRVLIRSGPSDPAEYLGFVTDRSLLSYFDAHAKASVALNRYLSNPLHSLALPGLNLRAAVVYCAASESVLDAMRLMSEQGLSSVAIVEDNPTATQMTLLSAVSVTDIGKMVVPSQSKQVLATPLHTFVAQIKEPDGSTDGVDKFPVYSVSAATSLRYTIEKILATNAHRVFITEDLSGGSSPVSTTPPSSAGSRGKIQLRGVVSIVDVLALFARLANLPDVDPMRMHRHRRASSASGSSRSSSRIGDGGDPRLRRDTRTKESVTE